MEEYPEGPADPQAQSSPAIVMPTAFDLPPGWLVCMSRTYNMPYYFNVQTNETLWERPVAEQVQEKNKVAVIVPFRDEHLEQHRSEHLRKFIIHMEDFFSRAHVEFGVEFHIYIIEQSRDGRKFNRGKLLNIGYVLAKQDDCNIFVFHDVDLLPSQSLLGYYCTKPHDLTPLHVARLWDRYSNNEKYFGGIVVFSDESFRAINGFPNTFWGWGGEDDELYRRITARGMTMDAPQAGCGKITDLEAMSIEDKINFLRQHKDWKCNVKWEVLQDNKDWETNGLANLTFEELSSEQLSYNCTRITVDVKLNDHWTDNTFELPYDKDKSKRR